MDNRILLEVGTEGGSLTVTRCTAPEGERFEVRLNEMDYGLEELSASDGIIGTAATFLDALSLLDRYPWFRMHPLCVDTGVETSVLEAVEARGGVEAHARWLSLMTSSASQVMEAEPTAHQQCPICGAEVRANARYPLYVCRPCAARAEDGDGRRLTFYNTHIGGGFEARFAGSGENYPSRQCYIDKLPCRADEARFGGIVIEIEDYRNVYDLEKYLFGIVSKTFKCTATISPLDFYFMLRWKSPRATTRHLKRLSNAAADYSSAVAEIGSALSHAPSGKERLAVLMRGPWKFRLPTATAILTILYPEDFSVYDIRVCDMLGDYHRLTDKSFSDSLWDGYQDFMSALDARSPRSFELRDKDRYLWGKSLYEDSIKAIQASTAGSS